MILGIDIGGTTLKFGVVTFDGEILEKKIHDTHACDDNHEDFLEVMLSFIKDFRERYEITGIGIGLPGLLSPDRMSTYTLANLPALNYISIVSLLKKEVKDIPIKIENDAKCAALGEMYFGNHKHLRDYLMIALGTGVGGGLVIDGKLFIGVKGNATEVGHIPLSDGITLEDHIGQEKITAYARKKLEEQQYANSSLHGKEISPKVIHEEALNHDQRSIDIFHYVGECIGEMLVGVIRLIDIDTFLLAGGVSGATEFIKPGIESVLHKLLPPYYVDHLSILRASLSADSGLLGAASLIMETHQTVEA